MPPVFGPPGTPAEQALVCDTQVPKRIGLKSYIRRSGVLVKLLSITSPGRFNASSARLNKP